MSSVIVDIYAAIAAWSPSVNNKTIKCRDLHQVRDTFAEGDHPMRMMLVTSGDTETLGAPFLSIGKLQNLTWVIEDRLYWRPIGAGQGLNDFNKELIQYCASYLEAVRDNRSFTVGITQAHVVDCRIVPSIVRWPDVEGGTPYAGVRCILTIQEIVSGA